ncbi:MAG: hypothetical protein ACLVJB_05835 [Christensenellales bacterium]
MKKILAFALALAMTSPAPSRLPIVWTTSKPSVADRCDQPGLAAV